MQLFPKKLQEKLNQRSANNALRSLSVSESRIDFSSNDYLGLAKEGSILEKASQMLASHPLKNGSTGSRLLSGNYPLYEEVEGFLADFHETEAAVIFNSGYDANLGFFSTVPQRGDIIIYDQWVHASIRDGIQMSHAKSYKFLHNDINNLKAVCKMHTNALSTNAVIYVVTESVFSMDGDSPDLQTIANYCEEEGFYLVVDEAHATGVFGAKGAGLLQATGIHAKVFARMVTFGKALGCHGAAILGSASLKKYLVNYARSYIYTTSLPPHAVATILQAYNFLAFDTGQKRQQLLLQNIAFFNKEVQKVGLHSFFIPSNSSIHSCLIPGNKRVKMSAEKLERFGFDVKPILSPTVPQNSERLRFCLHSFNTEKEISEVLKHLAILI